MDTQKRIILWASAALVILVAAVGTYQVATGEPTKLPRKDGMLSSPIDQNDWTKGAQTPKATVVEYSDFQCPACAAYYPLLEEVFAEYKDRVSFTYRHFPLTQHKNAVVAARAGEAAGYQGKFWEMADLLFKNQIEWADLSNADAAKVFESYAEKLGLDMARFKTDVASEATDNQITADQKSGLLSAVDQTPTLFINGKKISNPRSPEELKALLDDAIKNS